MLKVIKNRFEIANKVLNEIKKEMVEFIENTKEIPILTCYYFDEKRRKYITEKIDKYFFVDENISNVELEALYFNGTIDNFFKSEIYKKSDELNIHLHAKAKNESEIEKKQKYIPLKGFVEHYGIFGQKKDKYDNIINCEIEDDTVKELYSASEKKGFYIYNQTTNGVDKNFNTKYKYEKLKDYNEFVEFVFSKLKNNYLKKEKLNIKSLFFKRDFKDLEFYKNEIIEEIGMYISDNSKEKILGIVIQKSNDLEVLKSIKTLPFAKNHFKKVVKLLEKVGYELI